MGERPWGEPWRKERREQNRDHLELGEAAGAGKAVGVSAEKAEESAAEGEQRAASTWSCALQREQVRHWGCQLRCKAEVTVPMMARPHRAHFGASSLVSNMGPSVIQPSRQCEV